jgi:hypothetical protein
MTKPKTDTEDLRLAADTYRDAAFRILRQARRLQECTTALSKTRVRVAPAAIEDMAEAMGILMSLAPARSAAKVDKS